MKEALLLNNKIYTRLDKRLGRLLGSTSLGLYMPFGCIQYLNIASAASTAIGTIVLYRGSFAFETMPHYGSQNSAKEMSDRNQKRRLLQRIGVFLILAGLVLQSIVQFL